MEFAHLKQSDYKQMPWKNGQGSTLQMAIFPPNASLSAADFSWRLSSAMVKVDGAFSLFPGCDRFLAILEGAGLVLNFGDREAVLNPGHVLKFSGDESVHSQLTAGPIQDLNFIFQREKITADFEFLQGLNFKRTLLPGQHVFFSSAGSWEILFLNRDPVKLESHETLVISLAIEESCEVAIESKSKIFYFKAQPKYS